MRKDLFGRNEDDELLAQDALSFSTTYLHQIGLIDAIRLQQLTTSGINFVTTYVKEISYIPKEYSEDTTHLVCDVRLDFGAKQLEAVELQIPFTEIPSNPLKLIFNMYASILTRPSQVSDEWMLYRTHDNVIPFKDQLPEFYFILAYYGIRFYGNGVEHKMSPLHLNTISKSLYVALEMDQSNLWVHKRHILTALLRYETNPIKQLAVAERFVSEYPDSLKLLEIILGYYKQSDRQQSDQFAKLFRTNSELHRSDSGYNFFLVKAFGYLVSHEHYDLCEQIVNDEIPLDMGWTTDMAVNTYLRGILQFYQGNHRDSVATLKQVIVVVRDNDLIFGCSIYLLKNYLALNDIKGITATMQFLYSQFSQYGISYFIDGFAFITGLPEKIDAVTVLEQCLDTVDAARKREAIAVLLAVKYFIQNGGQKKCDDPEYVKKYLSTLKKNPIDAFMLYLISDLAFLIKHYETAVTHKLQYLFVNGSDYLEVDLRQCNKHYIANYAKLFIETYDGLIEADYRRRSNLSMAEIENMMQNYADNQFRSDIKTLYEHKHYSGIAQIYDAICNSADPNSVLIEQDFQEDVRFEIAYSLNNDNQHEKALEIYANIKNPSSSVLNNLATIYEKMDKLETAQKYIRKAKKLAPNDNTVERNYRRLTDPAPTIAEYVAEIEKKQVLQPASTSTQLTIRIARENHEYKGLLYYISVNARPAIEIANTNSTKMWDNLYEIADNKSVDPKDGYKNLPSNINKDDNKLQREIIECVGVARKILVQQNGRFVAASDISLEAVSLKRLRKTSQH